MSLSLNNRNKLDQSEVVADSLADTDSSSVDLPTISLPSEIVDGASIENPSSAISSGAGSAGDEGSTSSSVLVDVRNSIPPVKKMATDIELHLNSDLRKLYKEKSKYSRNLKKYATQFNDVVKEIRKIVRMLESLATLSYEELKKLWLKLIHKVV